MASSPWQESREHRVPALFDRLAREGYVDDRPTLESFVLARQGEAELPLHIRVLIGVGAAIASVCFIGFLLAANLIDYSDMRSLFLSGLVFMAAAIGLHRLADTAQTFAQSFLLQASFAAMAAGKILFVSAFNGYFDSPWGVSLAILLATAATYHVYRMSIDRFLSSFAVLYSIVLNIAWSDSAELPREALFNGFFVLQLAGMAVLFTHGQVRRDHVPVAYAFAFSLCATVLYLAISQTPGTSADVQPFQPIFANTLLVGGLVALFAWSAGSIDSLKQEPLIVASAGAVLLGVVSAPGILLSIGLMILGHARHDKLLLTLGALLMPTFLWLYYYNLDVSLLTKSLTLTGSGVVLLVGRYYLANRVQSREA